jgi:MFS family permease
MWVIAAALALIFADSTLPTPLYVIYQHALGLSEIVLALVFAAYVVGTVAALFFLGRVSDQIGRRTTLLPALALAAASMLVFLFAANLAGLFIARIITGLAVGLCAGAATAWIAELDPGRDRSRPAAVAAAANLAGLAIGPLLAGLLAQYAGHPLVLPYVCYLALIVLAAAGCWRVADTVDHRVHHPGEVSLRPRVGVPPGQRRAFIAPAANAFGIFALIGFYAALLPTLLARTFDQTSHATAGAVVAGLFVVATAAAVLTRHLDSQRAMLAGLGVLVPSAALLVIAAQVRSMPLLLIAAAMAGVSEGLGYRGGLEVVNQIAPGEQRAEILSAYLIFCYAGLSIPPVGVGVLSELASPAVAEVTFAATVAAIALAGLAIGIKYARQAPARSSIGP